MRVLMLILLSIPAAFAQGSGSVSAPSAPSTGGGYNGPDSPFAVTKSVSGKIVEIHKEAVIVELADGSKRLVKLPKALHIKADRDSELAGKKKLAAEDLSEGLPVKVTYRAEDNIALEIRVLKSLKG